MNLKIKVAGVSYRNTKPLLYGIERSDIINDIVLSVNYPAKITEQLQHGVVDIALLPVAAIPYIPNARIISDYGIAADGLVASVGIFSQVPMHEIREVYLDYQSRTSVQLAQTLMHHHWQQEVIWKPAPENYIDLIRGTTAGVIIGDRALQQLAHFEYVYDLAAHWKSFTGLPFIFAAWVSDKDLPDDFLAQFNTANALGLTYLDEIADMEPFPYYDLHQYYTQNIHFFLDAEKHKGLARFMELIA